MKLMMTSRQKKARAREKKKADAVVRKLLERGPIIPWEKAITAEEKELFLKHEAAQAIIWTSTGFITLSNEEFNTAAAKCPAACICDSIICARLPDPIRQWCMRKAPYYALTQPHAFRFVGVEGYPTLDDCCQKLSTSELNQLHHQLPQLVCKAVSQTGTTHWLLRLLDKAGDKLDEGIKQAITARL